MCDNSLFYVWNISARGSFNSLPKTPDLYNDWQTTDILYHVTYGGDRVAPSSNPRFTEDFFKDSEFLKSHSSLQLNVKETNLVTEVRISAKK